jgi:proteasome lid subunit RPN8/RPN11
MNKINFEIICSEELLKKIEEHCFSQTRTEVGGFLIGEIKDGKSIVTHVIKAKHTVAQMTQLTFTHKTWDAAFAERDKIAAGSELIGWFHSHPNFGVFLSDHDKFIQTQFFAQDGKVTIVVDPIKGKRGWFISQDKEVIPYAKEEDTTLEKLGLSETDSEVNMMAISGSNNNSGVSIAKVMVVAALFSIFSMLGGFLLANTANNSANQIANIEREISAIKYILDKNGLLVEQKIIAETPDPTSTKVVETPKPASPKVSKTPAAREKSPSPTKAPSVAKSTFTCYKGKEVKTITTSSGGLQKCPPGYSLDKPGVGPGTASPTPTSSPVESSLPTPTPESSST